MGVDVELSGLGDLMDELECMTVNVAAIENEALQAAAGPILEEAKKTSAFHDRSGKLRKSLSISKLKIGKTKSKYVLIGALSHDVFYGRMVEYGTSNANPHPFLEPAFIHHRAEASEIIANKLREALGK
jgi:HK97 gp10 family phage protein